MSLPCQQAHFQGLHRIPLKFYRVFPSFCRLTLITGAKVLAFFCRTDSVSDSRFVLNRMLLSPFRFGMLDLRPLSSLTEAQSEVHSYRHLFLIVVVPILRQTDVCFGDSVNRVDDNICIVIVLHPKRRRHKFSKFLIFHFFKLFTKMYYLLQHLNMLLFYK